jgi:hypothetical protein
MLDCALEPFEVVVAIPDAEGALLGGLNEGWESPERASDPPSSLEANVLVRVQVEHWPVGDTDRERLLFRAVDHLCEAFGDRGKRYLATRGPDAGRMTGGYA